MAGRIEVAQGYVTITPDLTGVQKRIDAELVPAATAAAKKAGTEIEQGIAEGAGKGAKEASDKLRTELPKGAEDAGKQAGDNVAKALSEPTEKASDKVAKDVQSKLTSMASRVGSTFKGLGTNVKGAFSGIKGAYSEALGAVGGTIKNSAIGRVFSGIAGAAKTAFAGVSGTVKGVIGFMGPAFAAAAKGIGVALSVAGTVASKALNGIRTVAGTVAKGVSAAFQGLGSVLSGPLSAIGGVVSTIGTAAVGAFAAAGAAVTALGKSALDAYGDFEQLQGGIKLSLGDDVWAQVEARSRQAFANMQISGNDYLQKVNSMATGLREALGGRGHEQEAADLADRVIKTQADIVSAMGITQEAADNAFNGIMKGNFTMLDNLALGIKPTKEGMQEVIDKMNEWNATQSDRTATQYNIDNLADCQSALADYVEYMGIAGYASSEGAETIQGSVSKMKAAWTDWVAELGKPDADMETATANLSTSLEDVASNVIPVLGRAVSTAIQQLPSLIATVGPELGTALVGILDTATGGLASQALEKLKPVTDAIGEAFGGIGDWFSENQGTIDTVASAFGTLGDKLSSSLGSAITTVAPLIGNLASGALATLPSVLDLAGGAVDFATGLFTHFGDAISPVTEALQPFVDFVGGALLDGMSKLGEAMSGIDWDSWSETVKGALQGVVDFVSDRIEEIKGFFEGVGKFIQDPVGSIQTGIQNLFGDTSYMADGVTKNFSTMAGGVQASTASMVGSIDNVNDTDLKDKKATYTASGNVITGSPATSIGNVTTAAGKMSSKSVSYTADGNVVTSTTVADRIWGVVGAVKNMVSKSIDVTTNYRVNGSPTPQAKADGGIIRRYATGAIFTKPTMTDVGIVGEAGAEAIYSNGRDTGIFPLTNRRYTGPFAREISEQVLSDMRNSSRPVAQISVSGVASPEQVADVIARKLALLGY